MSWRHEIFESVTPVKERNTEKSNCMLNHIPLSHIIADSLSRIYLHQLNRILRVMCFIPVATVHDWEIIQPASFDQLGRSAAVGGSSKVRVGEQQSKREGKEEEEGEGGGGSPKSVSSRERWRRAIEQQIMLQRMEKENQSLMSKALLVASQHHHFVFFSNSLNVYVEASGRLSFTLVSM